MNETAAPSLLAIASQNYAKAQAISERLGTLLGTLRGAQPRAVSATQAPNGLPGHSVMADCTATANMLEEALGMLGELFGVAGVATGEPAKPAYDQYQAIAQAVIERQGLHQGIQSGGVYNNGYGTTGLVR